jgi:hypothetical protein
VAERTIEPPFGVIGECMRQNGPSRLASGSVRPSLLLSRAHQRRDAERAGNQDALVVGVVAGLAERHHIVHRGAELLLGELRLAHEVVHVAHERAHDLAEARIRCALQLLQHRRRDVFLSLDDHVAFFFIGSSRPRRSRTPH